MNEMRNSTVTREECIVLKNNWYCVFLAKDRPVVYEYVHKPTGGVLLGDMKGSSPVFTICKGLDTLMQAHFKTYYRISHSDETATYFVSIVHENEQIVSLSLIFELTPDGLSIEFTNVYESENFHLMNVQLPRLLTVKAQHDPAYLAIPSDCGRLMDVTASSLREFRYSMDWISPLLVGLVYNDRVIGILDTDSFENIMVSSIYQFNEIKYGSLSMSFIYRLHDFDLVELGHKIPAISSEYHLKVQDSAKAFISLVGDYDGDGEISWVDAAKFIRNKIDATINPIYKDKIISKIALDLPDREEKITFDEVLDYVKSIAYVTNRQPHVVYLVGWQYTGHDTGYPAVDKVNERLGGYESLLRLIEKAKEYNTIISFHDNYDDAYLTSPHWDERVIARDSQGNLMKSGNFGTGQAYLLSNYEYAQKGGIERVQNTLKQYPVYTSYHIDVLSGGYKGGRKYDFNPENPSSSRKNLEGKIMIINEFKKYGLDVTTEDFSQLLIGQVSHFWHLNFFENVFFRNEQIIPLVPFIYHSKASYGYRCNSKRDVLFALLHGGSYSCDINQSEFVEQTGYYNLVVLPWLKLYGKAMKSYEKTGAKEKVVYEDGSYVEADFENLDYTVVAEGELIAQNFTTFSVSSEGLYLGYSLYGGVFTYRIPGGSANCMIKAVYKLNMNCTEKKTGFIAVGDIFRFEAEPFSSYRIIVEQTHS